MAVGAEGKVFFLDPKNRQARRRVHPGPDLFGLPPCRGGCGDRLQPRQPPRRAAETGPVLLRGGRAPRGRCAGPLSGRAGQVVAAAHRLRKLLEEFPEFIPALEAKAELCRKADLAFEEIDARCRLLELTGKETDPWLRSGSAWSGIATGQQIKALPILVGDRLYVGTLGGWMYAIDVRTLEVAARRVPRPPSTPSVPRPGCKAFSTG